MTTTHAARFAFLLAVPAFASAQVSKEWERVHSDAATPTEVADALVARPGGGWYTAGAYWTNNVHLPGLHYDPTAPLVQRLDDAGQLVWSRVVSIPFESLAGEVVLAVDPGGDAYLGYGSFGARIARVDPAGDTVWTSPPTASAHSFLPRGLVRAPAGHFVGAARMGPGYGFTVWDANGAVLNETTVAGAPTGSTLAATTDAGGRVAAAATDSSATGLVFVVAPDATLAWSNTTVDFRCIALAFGPSGELVGAGVDAQGFAHLRLWNASGAQVADHALTSNPYSAWNDVGFDAWGGVAVAGTTLGDALVATFDAAGVLGWQRTWASNLGFADSFAKLRVLASGDLAVSGSTGLNSGIPYYWAESQLLLVGWRRNGDMSWEHRDPTNGTDVESSVALEETPAGSIVSAGGLWRNNFVNPGYTPYGVHVLSLRPQSRAFCFGDALSAACPCGNASVGGTQEGCANSAGRGARLRDQGLASLSADTLVLTVEGTTPNAPCLFFQGSGTTNNPAVFGDGIRCAGGTLRRLYTRQASSGTASVPGPGDPTISARAAAAGDTLAAGSTRFLQTYYRDPNPTFCPSPAGSTFNAASALAITWSL